MLGTELRLYENNDGLYGFNGDKYGWDFFLLDGVDAPFLKPPNNDDYEGLLASLKNMRVRILRIQCNPGGGPRDDDDVDVAAVD